MSDQQRVGILQSFVWKGLNKKFSFKKNIYFDLWIFCKSEMRISCS